MSNPVIGSVLAVTAVICPFLLYDILAGYATLPSAAPGALSSIVIATCLVAPAVVVINPASPNIDAL